MTRQDLKTSLVPKVRTIPSQMRIRDMTMDSRMPGLKRAYYLTMESRILDLMRMNKQAMHLTKPS
jgi:hypothetical protein